MNADILVNNLINLLLIYYVVLTATKNNKCLKLDFFKIYLNSFIFESILTDTLNFVFIRIFSFIFSK